MKIQQRHLTLLFILSLVSVFTLTGCPWGGMKYYPAEKTSAWINSDEICFSVPESRDYQPVFISINFRWTPPKKRQFFDRPTLLVRKNNLCIPPAFYQFTDNSESPYIVEFILQSQNKNNPPRSFIAGFDMIAGKPSDVQLTKQEYDVPGKGY